MIRSIDQLKDQFASRDRPTQSDFNDLIDTLTAFNQGTLLPAAFRPSNDDSIMGSEGGVPAWLPKGLQTFKSSFFGHDQTNTDDYEVTLVPDVSSWAQLDGVPLTIRVDNANTTTNVTLKVNTLPAKDMVAPNGNLLSAGLLSNNFTFIAIYSADEDVVEVIAATAEAVGAAGGDLTGNYPNPEIAAAAVDATHINAGTMTVGYYLKLGAGNVLEWAEVTTDIGQPRPPNGPAGGSLNGTYPNPGIRDSVLIPSNLVVPVGPSEGQRLAYKSGGFEWVDELTLTYITPVGLGHKYLSEPAPGNWSVTAHEMTTTGSWVLLDLSTQVPQGTRYVVLNIHAQWKSAASQANAGYLDFSADGATSLIPGIQMTVEMLDASTQRGQAGQQIVVPLDENRRMWYRLSFGGFASGVTQVLLSGYYSGDSQLGLPSRPGALTVSKSIVIDYNDNVALPTPDADIAWLNDEGGFLWTVPDGVDSVRIRMWGAGGGGYDDSNNINPGGSGAYVEAVRSVVPGDNIAGVIGKGGLGKGADYTTGDPNDIVGGSTTLAIGGLSAGGGALEDAGGDPGGFNPSTDLAIHGGPGWVTQDGLVGFGGNAPQGGRGGGGTNNQDYAEGYGNQQANTYPAQVPGGGGGGHVSKITLSPNTYHLLNGAHGRMVIEYLTPAAGGIRGLTQVKNRDHSLISAPADTWVAVPGLSASIVLDDASDKVMLMSAVYLSAENAFQATRITRSNDGITFTEIPNSLGNSDGVRPVAGSPAQPYALAYCVGAQVLHLVDAPGASGTWHYRVEAICSHTDMLRINGSDAYTTQYTGVSTLTLFVA